MYKIDEVDRLGLEVRDSANFQTIPCLLGRLGSGVRVGASFHIFALTAGARGNCPGGKLSEGGNVRGGNVLYCPYIQLAEGVSIGRLTLFISSTAVAFR